MDGICFSSLKGSGLAHDKIFAGKYASAEGRKEDFPQNRRAARSCTSVKPESTFATATDPSCLCRSAQAGEKDEEKIMRSADRKINRRERVWNVHGLVSARLGIWVVPLVATSMPHASTT